MEFLIIPALVGAIGAAVYFSLKREPERRKLAAILAIYMFSFSLIVCTIVYVNSWVQAKSATAFYDEAYSQLRMEAPNFIVVDYVSPDQTDYNVYLRRARALDSDPIYGILYFTPPQRLKQVRLSLHLA